MLRRFIIILFIIAMLYSLHSIKIGYALSGGGARGFAHIGILKVLEEVGISPDYISGTSIGALVGGLYAMGYNSSQIESLFVKTDWSYIFSDNWNREELFIGQKRWAPYGNAFFRLDHNWIPQLPQSVVMGNRINLELFRVFAPASQIIDFNNLPIPFSCISTDLVNGSQVVFTQGSLMQAIRASMSIPTILQPFPLNNTLYIDGGISQNLPGAVVREMGAEFVLGFKANSGLREVHNLRNIVHVLDQTINIGIINNLNEQILACDFVIEPDLDLFSSSSFMNIKEIIDAGEASARKQIDSLMKIKSLARSDNNHKINFDFDSVEQYLIKRIFVYGNEYLSSSKIKEYLGIQPGVQYTINDIVSACESTWNSQLFDMIYPVMEKEEDGYLLKIFVKEKERKYLAINLSYDKESEFVAGIVLSLHNYFLKNSHLLSELKLGGKSEFNIDVVKNFGDYYGIYYRLFPYLTEKRIYFYNDAHEKITSARSLEYGLTSGIGLYAAKLAVLEGYGFYYRTNLYREVAISDTINKSVAISGVGIKVYHESLDDYYFPMRGHRLSFKLSFSQDKVLSDDTIDRCKLRYDYIYPLQSNFSLISGLYLGCHFLGEENKNFDPFYLGGINNFSGFAYYEMSSAFYQIMQTGIAINPYKNLYLNAKVQAINYSDKNNWIPQKLLLGYNLEIGIKSYLGPIRTALSYSERRNIQFYILIGYTNDLFHFSRR